MEAYLPEYCYRNKPVKLKGIVIHYFSAINVKPRMKFDNQTCWNLMHDLNAPKENRIQFPDVLPETMKRSYASAHCMIGRAGKNMIMVPADKQAYHAGKSSFGGITNWNQWSYGIELIGSKDSQFTDAQYRTCAKVCARLMDEHPISIDMVVGHEEVAPNRKVDPGIATGNFDMERLKSLIHVYLAKLV